MVTYALQTDCYVGASFDNWLDAVDGSFCTFEGGDDPNFVKLFASTGYIPSHLPYRMESTQTLCLVALKVGMASHYIYIGVHYLRKVPSPVASSPLPSSCLFLMARMRQVSLLNMRIVGAQNMQRSAALVNSHTSLLHGF